MRKCFAKLPHLVAVILLAIAVSFNPATVADGGDAPPPLCPNPPCP